MTQSNNDQKVLVDLARAKALFQQRTIAVLLADGSGRPAPDQNPVKNEDTHD